MKIRNRAGVATLILLAGAALFAQGNPVEGPPRPASFSGIVFNDLTGEPVAHVHIYLSKHGKIATAEYQAVTDTEGRFFIHAIKPGNYSLLGGRRGYSSPRGSWFGGENFHYKSFEFGSDAEISDVVVKLVPNSAIDGHVVDSNGAPMERVTVQAINGTVPVSVETDDRGAFRIGGLAPGRYLLWASRDDTAPPEVRTDGSMPVNYALTWFPGSATIAAAMPITIQAGEDAENIEIKMLPAPVLHISGQVSGAVRGSALSVHLIDGLRNRTYGTAEDGRFALWRVPPGRYLVMAESSSGGRFMRSVPVPVDLTQTSIEGVSLKLEYPVHLVLKPENTDAEKLKILDINLTPIGAVEHEHEDASTDHDGIFELKEVWPGRYHVLVGSVTTDNEYVKVVRSDQREFPDGTLELSGGPAKQEMVFELASDGAEVSGVVRTATGNADSEHRVALYFDDDFGCDLAEEAEVRQGGVFSFKGIAPGKYRLLAYDGRNLIYPGSVEMLELYRDIVEKIEVKADDKKTVELKTLDRE